LTAGSHPYLPAGRALAVWLVIAFTESLHGALRRLLVEPQLGDLAARQLSVATGSLLVLLIAWIFRRWMRLASARQCVAVGLLWVALTLAFEIGLGLALGLGWERIASDYDLAQGGLMPLGLLAMAMAPLLARPRTPR
jgi:hypothetical protein